jgi:uncharacterized protein
MSAENPFHEGELKAQRLAGETAEAESNSAMISGTIMAGAINFIRAQEMAIISSVDAEGRRWASFVFGEKGFLQPVDRMTLRVEINPAEADREDPLWNNIQNPQRIGLLVIDLATRRRLRVNGPVHRDGDSLEIQVMESYPNCPKYITRREISIRPRGPKQVVAKNKLGIRLEAEQLNLIRQTDVLFMATGHPERGADTSHRGGKPGFVEVLDDRALRIPDYSGNGLFNTLGNLLVDPHVGLLVPDFEGNRALQITGTAKIEWAGQDPTGASGGTHRFVDVHIDEWSERPLGVDLTSVVIDYSPYDP